LKLFPFFHAQLNSPNRILLLHLSIVCLALSILYLWALINNAIIPSYTNRVDLPESLAITTVTTTAGSVSLHSHYSSILYSHLGSSADFISTTPLSSSSSSSTTTTAVTAALKTTVYDSVYGFNDLLIHLLQPMGLATICGINFDRYYAICSPLHYNNLLTTKKVSFLQGRSI
jgi:hypothetical protein